MVSFSRKGMTWLVIKHESVVGIIRLAKADESNEWGNVFIEHHSGRIDRHHRVEDAKAVVGKL